MYASQKKSELLGCSTNQTPSIEETRQASKPILQGGAPMDIACINRKKAVLEALYQVKPHNPIPCCTFISFPDGCRGAISSRT